MRSMVWALTGLLWLSQITVADDGAISGVGGAPKLMKEHPSVRMVRETVEVWVPECRVVARFTFRNESRRAVNVLMGFPESGYGGRGEHSTFEYFRSYVRGERVSTKRVRAEKGGPGGFQAYWLKRVHFGPRETVEVANRYVGGFGGSVDGTRFFRYTLSTGASWHGTIGRVRTIVHEDSRRDWFEGSGRRPPQRDHTRVLEWRDMEPTRSDGLGVQWSAEFLGVTVDGHRITGFNCFAWQKDSGVERIRLSQRIRPVGEDVRLPARCARTWMGCDLGVTHPGAWSVRYARFGRSVTLTEGSRTMLVNGHRRRLAWTPRERHGALIVRLRPIVEGLGGTMYWSWQQQRYIVWLPAR